MELEPAAFEAAWESASQSEAAMRAANELDLMTLAQQNWLLTRVPQLPAGLP